MTPKITEKSEQINALFEDFIYTGLSDDERKWVHDSSHDLQQRLTDATDMIRGLLADREGREAFAKALREGRKDV